jgi:glycosyltransferase involved in cell wall biosynthesis
VPFGDDSSIGDALSQLSGDPAVRRRMGEAARNRVVENYSTSRVVERYETLLSEVMASK